MKNKIKSETVKDFMIKPAKKPYNFNSRSFRRSEKRMLRHLDGYSTGGLLWKLFRPRYNSFFWKGTHNGVFGPGGHTHWEFRTGSLALVIALICLVLIIVIGLWILI